MMRTSRRHPGTKFPAALLAVMLFGTGFGYATSVYVAPGGSPTGQGTIEDPMTFSAGLARARDDGSVTEVIVRGGTYNVSGSAGSIDPVPSGPNLTVWAYPGETPIFDNATQVTSSNPVTGMPGVYTTTERPADADPNTYAYVWETDTPAFYTPVDDLDSCAAIAASTYYDRSARVVYFHTSDGQSPLVHTIYSSHNAFNVGGLYVWRANTTIDGLTFKNFVASIAIANYGINVTIRNCRFDYCRVANTTASWQGDASITVEYCEGINTAQGLYSEAKLGTVFRHNKFTKARNRGMIPTDPQNDMGYQVYFTGLDATIEYNFSQGYRGGCLIKTLAGEYSIRHNTFVFCQIGIESQVALSRSNVSYNVVALGSGFQRIMWDDTLTYGNNLYWDVNKTTQQGQDSFLAGGNAGSNNVFGDPRFLDPRNGDYRLLPASPVPKDGDIPAGAFGYVSAAEAYAAKPTVRLDLDGLVRPYRPEFSSLDPDFWTNELQYPTYLITAIPDLPLRLATSPGFSLGLLASPTTPVLRFAGWTTNPPATVIVAAPSQASTSVTATTGGTVTANWEQDH